MFLPMCFDVAYAGEPQTTGLFGNDGYFYISENYGALNGQRYQSCILHQQ